MKFFVRATNGLIPVKLANQPKDEDDFNDFQKVNGSGYSGTNDQFALLRLDKKTKRYTAFGIIRSIKTPEVVQPQTIQLSEAACGCQEEETSIGAVETPAQADENGYRKFTFIFHNPSSTAIESYRQEKRLWVNNFGSEQLQLALSMNCKCDNKYIFERVELDFKPFRVVEEFQYAEIDTPDFGVLSFIKEHFGGNRLSLIRRFDGRVLIGHEYNDSKKVGPEFLIVENFLSMCDLVCPLQEFVHYVTESDRKRM